MTHVPGRPGPYDEPPGRYNQPPGPYGHQQGPYGGYPPQPQYQGAPVPPPGGGRGNLFKGKPRIGGGTWFALSGDGKDDSVSKSSDAPKPKWHSSAGTDRTMTPLTTQDGSVVVYIAPTYSVGGAVATIAPAGGAPKVVLKHPLSTAETEASFMEPRTVYADGRFFLATTRISALNDTEERETNTMMAFGK